MGYYIETEAIKGKAGILKAYGAEELDDPPSPGFASLCLALDSVLICVVDNGPFEAAAIIFSDKEQEAHEWEVANGDPRKREWLIMSIAEVLVLAPEASKILGRG